MKKNTYKTISKTTLYLGLFLLALILIAERIFLKRIDIETNIYAKLFTALLIYSGVAFHFLVKEKRPFRKSFNYLRSNANYIYVSILIFITFVFFGFILHENLAFLDEILKKILEQTFSLNPTDLTVFIFLNNLIASLTGFFGGIVFGIFPILSSMANGLIIGYVVEKVGILQTWRLLPHGIFELPAVFISFGLGIKLGGFVLAKNKKKELLGRLYNSLLVLTFVVVPLLVIAALIEGALIMLLP